ncbi:MAG: hypothetical protein JNJ50_26200 [Acidobacteria bacterium]|nr:hypothetical protein [Acidobacteriota bacterium]
MSAAIQLINQSVLEAVPVETEFEKPLNNVSLFELAPEQRMRRMVGRVTDLQREVRTLREELARAERSAAHYEQLLRNATVREQELRAQLAEQMR